MKTQLVSGPGFALDAARDIASRGHAMKIVVEPSTDHVADFVHDVLVATLNATPAAVLGLPTGGTPIPVYSRLVDSYRSGRCSFRHATTFNLDEYVGLGAAHPASYAAYMREHLFDHVDCPPGQRNIPDGLASDAALECASYEQAIASAGGLDFLLLGLGQNAHIGFNEPGSDFATRTRLVELTASTIAANARYFEPGHHPPTTALSMGIGTIIEARKIIIMATGATKAEAVRRMIVDAPSTDVPASALQMSVDVTVVLDPAAAAKL